MNIRLKVGIIRTVSSAFRQSNFMIYEKINYGGKGDPGWPCMATDQCGMSLESRDKLLNV